MTFFFVVSIRKYDGFQNNYFQTLGPNGRDSSIYSEVHY